MRIAIFTLPLHCNYGGIVQAYALQTTLQHMGHEVFLYDTPFPGQRKPVKTEPFWRTMRRFLLFNKEIPQRVKPKIPKREVHRRRHIARFLNTHFFLRPIYNRKADLDAIVVGSDQIWRPAYLPEIELAFLSFAKDWPNLKRVAYACSFGTDQPEYSAAQIQQCGELVSRFDGVSVREASMIPLIQSAYRWNCHPVLLLDPTLLLEPDDYRQLYRPYSPQKNEGDLDERLFCYFLDSTEAKQTIKQKMLEKNSLKELTQADLSPKEDALDGAEDYPSIESWLHAFDAAKYVLTDSFHGCVFSILFNKPFVVIGNPERGMARFHSLLGIFGLEQRLVDPTKDIAPELLAQPIDWEAVNRKRQQLKSESLAFLRAHLSS